MERRDFPMGLFKLEGLRNLYCAEVYWRLECSLHLGSKLLPPFQGYNDRGVLWHFYPECYHGLTRLIPFQGILCNTPLFKETTDGY